MALAICYELSVPAHTSHAFRRQPEVFVASVAKTSPEIPSAMARLREIATTFRKPVLMSNCVGPTPTDPWGGNTAVWNSQGDLVAQLNARDEGLLLLDTERGTAAAKYVAENSAVVDR